MNIWLHRGSLAAALALALLAVPAQAQQDAAVLKRATELREGPAQTSASLGALAADSSVARTGERKGSWVKVRTPQGAATSTVGIRGLGAEDIANAQPNPTAVRDAEKLRVSAEQAQRFASASALRTQRVEPLPEPPRPASGGSQFTTDNMSPN